MALVPERDDLQALEGYHSAQVDVEVRLNTNESPYPPPASWRDEVAAAVAGIAWERYPDRRAVELRRAIAAWHGVHWEQVFAANGSNEVLQTLLLAYGGHGRRVVTFEPTYQLHGHIARITGAEVVEGERGSDFALDEDAALALIEAAQPAVTFLCSPNNPTGRVESPSLVRRVLDAAPGLVVVDEAYAQFADWSALDLVDDARPLCVVRTFSKTWSMAGARLGYLVGPTWVVETMEKVVLPYHLDAAKQLAGTLALAHVAGDGRPGAPDRRRARAPRRGPRPPRRRRVPERCELRPVPAPAGTGPSGVAGAGRARRPRPRLLELAPADRLPAGDDRHA